jgi:Sigma-70, region 4
MPCRCSPHTRLSHPSPATSERLAFPDKDPGRRAIWPCALALRLDHFVFPSRVRQLHGAVFEKRPVDPKAYQALDRVVAAHEAMRAAEADRSNQASIRSAAITEARENGLSLDAIAERLGVSRERVGQMIHKGDG